MKSARNVIDVVEALAAGPAGLSELARRTEIPKSTVQRCLDTLADAGWIGPAPDPASGARTAWQLSERVGQIGPAAITDPVELIRPIAVELARRTGEAVHIVGLDGTDVVLLERVGGDGPVQVVLPIGFRVPAYASATGKAMLSALSQADVAQHLPDRLRALTATTVTSRSALESELAQTRDRGWATNAGEWERSVVAVAAAIMDRSDADRPQLYGALSVSATPQRLTDERLEPIGRLVRAAADDAVAIIRARRGVGAS